MTDAVSGLVAFLILVVLYAFGSWLNDQWLVRRGIIAPPPDLHPERHRQPPRAHWADCLRNDEGEA